MSRSKKINNNGFRGKVGEKITYLLKGQLVERTVGIITKDPTDLQKANRQTMALVTDLLNPVVKFVAIGFRQDTKNTLLSPYNKATAVNKLHAINGIYPDQQIDYTKVQLSKGNLPLTEEITVTGIETGLQFNWNPSLSATGMSLKDRVMLVAYSEVKRKAFFEINGAQRREGTESLIIPRYQEKVLFHTYLTFISPNGERIADSQYVGEVLW